MPPNPVAATDTAENELREQGFIGQHGLKDEMEDLLAIFANAELEADVKFAPAPGREVRALVAMRGRSAARWLIDGDEVSIEPVKIGESAYGTLVKVLPEVPPVSGKPVSLRTDDLREASQAAIEQPDEAEQVAIRALRHAGVRSPEARSAVRMLSGGRTLQGQFGTAAYTKKSRKRVRGSNIIEVMDTSDGRVIRYQTGTHTTIAPGEPGLITRAISRIVEEARENSGA